MKCYQNLPIILKTLKTINVQDSNLYSGIQVLPNRPINFINQPGKKKYKKKEEYYLNLAWKNMQMILLQREKPYTSQIIEHKQFWQVHLYQQQQHYNQEL